MDNSENICFRGDGPAVYICNKHNCHSLGLCKSCFKAHESMHRTYHISLKSMKTRLTMEIIELRKIKELTESVYDKNSSISNDHYIIKFCNDLLKDVNTFKDDIEKALAEINEVMPFMLENIPHDKDFKSSKDFSAEMKVIIMKVFELKENARFIYYVQYLPEIKNNVHKSMVQCLHDKNALVLIDLEKKNYILRNFPQEIVPSFTNSFVIGMPSIIKIDDFIYFIGGFNGKKATNRTCKTSLKNFKGSIVEFSSMKIAKYDIALTHILKRCIYAITGSIYDGSTEIHTKDCQLYDINNDTWENIASLNIGRAAPGICSFNNRYIYIYGGELGPGVKTNTIEAYDALDDEAGWTIYRNKDLPVEFHELITSLDRKSVV